MNLRNRAKRRVWQLKQWWTKFSYYYLGGKERIEAWEANQHKRWLKYFSEGSNVSSAQGSNKAFREWWASQQADWNLGMALQNIKSNIQRAKGAIAELKKKAKKK